MAKQHQQKINVEQVEAKAKNENNVKVKVDIEVRYRLLDQRLHNTVQIYDAATGKHSVLPALTIAKDRNMIRAFYPDEACMIGLIAGQACAEPAVLVS